jgi:hypothetical protein
MAESATSVGSLTFLGLFAMFSLRLRFHASEKHRATHRRKPGCEAPAPLRDVNAKPLVLPRLVRYFRNILLAQWSE